MPSLSPIANRIKLKLQKGLATRGVEAEISVHPISGTKMHRFYVVSDKFKRMEFTERQAVVWRIANSLPESDQTHISMIVTLTHAEVGTLAEGPPRRRRGAQTRANR
jgi:hypothetical protein